MNGATSSWWSPKTRCGLVGVSLNGNEMKPGLLVMSKTCGKVGIPSHHLLGLKFVFHRFEDRGFQDKMADGFFNPSKSE